MNGQTSSSLRVALLAGGESAESEISLASGLSVAAALDEAGHHVELFDPAQVPIAQIPWSRFDVCFIALHGGAGEDGRVQQALDALGVPYTGSGPSASRLAMSKSASKERFLQASLPTPPYVLFHATEPHRSVAARVAALGYPLVVKPDAQGSSLGVGLARDESELARCLDACRALDDFAIAEPLVAGREFTVALLDRQALPILEIVTPRPFFDFEAKQHATTTDYHFDCDLPSEVIHAIERIAVAAARCLSTRGLVRVDLILDAHHGPQLLEVNTVPGLTARSLAPKAAARAGLSMAALCDRLLRDCLQPEVTR